MSFELTAHKVPQDLLAVTGLRSAAVSVPNRNLFIEGFESVAKRMETTRTAVDAS